MKLFVHLKKSALKIIAGSAVICMVILWTGNQTYANEDFNKTLSTWFKKQVNEIVNQSIFELDQSIQKETEQQKIIITNEIQQEKEELQNFKTEKSNEYGNKMDALANQLMAEEQLQGEQELQQQLDAIILNNKNEINNLLNQ